MYFSQTEILIGGDGDIEKVAENMENLGLWGFEFGKKINIDVKLDYWVSLVFEIFLSLLMKVLKGDDEGDGFSGFDDEHNEYLSLIMNFNILLTEGFNWLT